MDENDEKVVEYRGYYISQFSNKKMYAVISQVYDDIRATCKSIESCKKWIDNSIESAGEYAKNYRAIYPKEDERDSHELA